ncbi:hypothetical protein FZC66_18760 [Priestia megaterium]|nr:hypothetical protein FZC66_18760 [Priestia megaterium]
MSVKNQSSIARKFKIVANFENIKDKNYITPVNNNLLVLGDLSAKYNIYKEFGVRQLKRLPTPTSKNFPNKIKGYYSDEPFNGVTNKAQFLKINTKKLGFLISEFP